MEIKKFVRELQSKRRFRSGIHSLRWQNDKKVVLTSFTLYDAYRDFARHKLGHLRKFNTK